MCQSVTDSGWHSLQWWEWYRGRPHRSDDGDEHHAGTGPKYRLSKLRGEYGDQSHTWPDVIPNAAPVAMSGCSVGQEHPKLDRIGRYVRSRARLGMKYPPLANQAG